jgi:hypothetical protein
VAATLSLLLHLIVPSTFKSCLLMWSNYCKLRGFLNSPPSACRSAGIFSLARHHRGELALAVPGPVLFCNPSAIQNLPTNDTKTGSLAAAFTTTSSRGLDGPPSSG